MTLPTPEPIERWIIVFTGFLQEGRLSGLEKIEHAIHQQCNCDSTRVILKSWQDSPGAVASRIWNRQPEGHPPAIVIIGFSYGGFTAVLLARELGKRGLKIETMLLIDPVWRWLAELPSVLSLGSWWEINVPKTVRTLFAWFQKVDRPRGHRLIVDENHTLYFPKTLKRTHNQMDDAEEVYKKALLVACPERKTA